MASSGVMPDCSGSSRTPASVGGTNSGSCRADSSTSRTPSANRSATARAARSAVRLLPTPPGPTSVTSRDRANSAFSTASSSLRPTKLVNSTGS